VNPASNEIRGSAESVTIADPLEREWVARSIAGDADAFGRLALACQDRVFNVCLRLVGNRADAEELTQQALLAAYQAIRGFDGRSAFYTWLYRIAVNQCLSWRRRAERRTVSMEARGVEPVVTRRPASNPSPEEAADTRAMHALVLAALDRLEPDQRAVVVLRDIESLDYDAIAAILGVPRGTVKSRLHRAREALRQVLSPMMNGCPP
jgi:RNA polymerase sigma-70 factor (ECF subfamily)